MQDQTPPTGFPLPCEKSNNSNQLLFSFLSSSLEPLRSHPIMTNTASRYLEKKINARKGHRHRWMKGLCLIVSDHSVPHSASISQHPSGSASHSSLFLGQISLDVTPQPPPPKHTPTGKWGTDYHIVWAFEHLSTQGHGQFFWRSAPSWTQQGSNSWSGQSNVVVWEDQELSELPKEIHAESHSCPNGTWRLWFQI